MMRKRKNDGGLWFRWCKWGRRGRKCQKISFGCRHEWVVMEYDSGWCDCERLKVGVRASDFLWFCGVLGFLWGLAFNG